MPSAEMFQRLAAARQRDALTAAANRLAATAASGSVTPSRARLVGAGIALAGAIAAVLPLLDHLGPLFIILGGPRQ